MRVANFCNLDPVTLFSTSTMRSIYYVSSMIDSIEWKSHRSMSIRMVNVFRVLISAMYGVKSEDGDSDPMMEIEDKTEDHDKIALELAIKARQSQDNLIQSYNDLAATLQEQDRKKAERERGMK